jgi:hypothetical protein
MKFGTFLVLVQLAAGAVFGLIAVAVAVGGGRMSSVVVLIWGSIALALFALITASAYRTRARHDH